MRMHERVDRASRAKSRMHRLHTSFSFCQKHCVQNDKNKEKQKANLPQPCTERSRRGAQIWPRASQRAQFLNVCYLVVVVVVIVVVISMQVSIKEIEIRFDRCKICKYGGKKLLMCYAIFYQGKIRMR